MKLFLFSLVLVWAVILKTEGLIDLGSYGTHYATKKRFFHSLEEGLPSTHQETCKAAGLTTLSLETFEEFEYFLALLRFISMEDWVGIGGRESLNLWYWQSSNVRLNYPMQWFPNFPILDTERNCLHINMNGFANFHCDSRGINSTVFCQKIGA